MTSQVKIALKIAPYDDRRFGRPWIAKIKAWPTGGKPLLEWGAYIGDSRGGFVEIVAYPGDVMRDGQKDCHGNCGRNDWSVVLEDGSLKRATPVEAKEAFDRKRANTPKVEPSKMPQVPLSEEKKKSNLISVDGKLKEVEPRTKRG